MKRIIIIICTIFFYSTILASEGIRGTVQFNLENNKYEYFPVLFSYWHNYLPNSPSRNNPDSWYMGKEMFGVEFIAGIGFIYYTELWKINLVPSLEYKCDHFKNQQIVNIDSEFLTALSPRLTLKLGTGFQNKYYAEFYEASDKKSKGQHPLSYGVVNRSKIIFGWKPVPAGEFYIGDSISYAYAAEKKETYVYNESGQAIEYVGEVGFIKTGFYKNRLLAGYSGFLNDSTVSLESIYDYIPDRFEGARYSINFEIKFSQKISLNKTD